MVKQERASKSAVRSLLRTISKDAAIAERYAACCNWKSVAKKLDHIEANLLHAMRFHKIASGEES